MRRRARQPVHGVIEPLLDARAKRRQIALRRAREREQRGPGVAAFGDLLDAIAQPFECQRVLGVDAGDQGVEQGLRERRRWQVRRHRRAGLRGRADQHVILHGGEQRAVPVGQQGLQRALELPGARIEDALDVLVQHRADRAEHSVDENQAHHHIDRCTVHHLSVFGFDANQTRSHQASTAPASPSAARARATSAAACRRCSGVPSGVAG